MRLRITVLALLASAASAGCGATTGTTPKAEADPAPAASNAKADETCVKFLHFPAEAVFWGNVKQQLRYLEWAERHVRVAAQEDPGGDAKRVIAQLREAQRVRRRGARADAVRDDAVRAYDDFYQRYRDAAIDAKLERCVEEQAVMDEQEAKFTRSAEALCEDTMRGIKTLPRGAPIRKHAAQVRKLDGMVDKLDGLTPPASKRPLWNRAMRDMKVALGELRDLLALTREAVRGNAGSGFVGEVEAAQRRSVRAVERADRAFQGLYLEPCAGD